MKRVYFSPSQEAFRLGNSKTVSFFDLTIQKQLLKVLQFLKNRLRLAGRAQSFPEMVPELRHTLAQQGKTRLTSCHTARLICAHTSAYIPTCPQPPHSAILLVEVGLCQYWQKKEQQKEKKEGMTFQLILPASGQANQKCVKS